MTNTRALDPAPLIAALATHGVRFVVNGSVAALAAGLELSPGDLDLAPALDRDNLARLGAALESLGARPKHLPGWEGSLTLEQCAAWRPDPADAHTLDHRFDTVHGELDVCPRQAGEYEALAPRAIEVAAFEQRFQVAHPEDVVEAWRRWNRPRDRERIERLATIAAELDREQAPARFAERLERAFPLGG